MKEANNENQIFMESFDYKEFLYKLISYWRLYVILIVVGLFIAFVINRYSTKIYRISTLVNIKESENPLASSNVSLMFKWGGSSELIQSHIAILKSRNHNKKVIERLNLEVEYYSTGRIKIFTRYGQTPFIVKFDRDHRQILNVPFHITFSDDLKSFSLDMEDDRGADQIRFTKDGKAVPSIDGTYDLDDWVEFDQAKFKVEIDTSEITFENQANWFFRFNTSTRLVNSYISSLTVKDEQNGSSLLTISMVGDSKKKLVSYLNTSIELLKEYELEQKNLLADNTIHFVDLQIQGVIDTLKSVEKELEDFRVNNQVVNLSNESSRLYDEYIKIDGQKAELILAEKYYTYLLNYLKTGDDDFSTLMTPSVVGIQDPVLIQLVNNLVELSVKRNRLVYSLQDENPAIQQIRSEITLTKNSLRENVTNLITATNIQIDDLNERTERIKDRISTYPSTEQQLVNIKRRYELSSRQYDFLIEKRAEAELSKAGNLPDVQVIDEAIDYGVVPIKPRRLLNYLIGLIMGFFMPTVYVLLKELFNSKISSKRELERGTNIPIIGTIGHSEGSSNIVIQNGLKSSVAESFRIIRTNLKFLMRKMSTDDKDADSSKVILLTSSIGGEGKTFCAINLASIISIGGTKTVIIGLDMRKPKIFNDFNVRNDVGLSDYLIGQVSSKEIINKTQVENLDFITAGPVPPNPSELLLSPYLGKLLDELKETYDYIVLDTPPLALVSDALELMKYADGILYVTRQNYTEIGLLEVINNYYATHPQKNISIIFNDVVVSGYGYGYNYGYSYGYSYGYGYYDDDNERVPWWKKII